MATAPPKPCRVPRCPSLVTPDRPCPRHPRTFGPGRGGSTRAWRNRRAAVLRERPFCEDCALEGAPLRLATEVDHVKPVSEGGTDEWENLRPLCSRHHDAKTARDRAAARARSRAVAGVRTW
jgi:5-methylcytosine-specific restriction protein A